MNPAISIVVPAYNARATILASVRSALRQSVENLEVVVVDDGSTDGTHELLAEISDPRLRCLRQENRGLPAARNAGIAAARGDNVAFLDSDDLLLPRYAELALDALGRAPEAGFAYTDAWVLDAQTRRVRRRSAMSRSHPPIPPPSTPAEFLIPLMRINFVFVAATVRRSVLTEIGGFAEDLASSEDYELWLRILLAGHAAAWIPGRQAIYRKHSEQMSKNLTQMAESLVAVYDRIDLDALPSDEHRRLLLHRRDVARAQVRFFSRVRGAAALRLTGALKRAGIGERWLASPPPEVTELLALERA